MSSSQGLHVLWDGVEPVVTDIVFVHGLRGDAYKTWTQDTVLWPRDLLKDDVPNARILTWGYDSNVAQLSEFSSKNSIFNHAENFLLDLTRLRRKDLMRKGGDRNDNDFRDKKLKLDSEILRRPIIFVAHSLGGVLVKQALIRSTEYLNNNQDISLGAISRSTIGVVFLGTPHRGSSKTSLGGLVQTVAKIALRQPNKNLLVSIEEDSQILEAQRKSFDSISRDWTLACLYEEKPMSIGLIVPSHSACMDGFNVRTAGIPKNHTDMCKFSDSTEIGYQRTSDYIIALVESSVAMAESMNRQKQNFIRKMAQNAQSAILDSLGFPEIEFRHEEIDHAHAKTFRWMFEVPGPRFVNWLISGTGIYWISGKAGSGKSTLMKYLYNDPRLRMYLPENYQIAGFFFHDRGSQIQKSQDGLIRSILYQVMSHSPHLIPELFPRAWHSLMGKQRLLQGNQGSHWSPPELIWSHRDLLECFRKMLGYTLSSSIGLFLLIDGLDEYEGDKDDLVNLLASWRESLEGHNSRLKLCVSSRPWNVFQEAFLHCPSITLQDLTRGDIMQYVTDKFGTSTRMKRLRITQPSKAEKLVSDIVEKSSGVFLWVVLVVKRLVAALRDQDTMEELQEHLDRLPAELEPLFDRMWFEIRPEHLVQASRLFQIVQAATEPQSTLTMWFANRDLPEIIQEDPEILSSDELISRFEEVDGRLRSRCAGLLEIQFKRPNDSVNKTLYDPAHLEIARVRATLQTEVSNVRSDCVDPSTETIMNSTVQALHRTVKEYLQKYLHKIETPTESTLFNPHIWLHRSYLRQVAWALKDNSPKIWDLVALCSNHARETEDAVQYAQTTSLQELDRILTGKKELLRHSCHVGMGHEDSEKLGVFHWSEYQRICQWHETRFSEYCPWHNTFLSFAIGSGLCLYVQQAIESGGATLQSKKGRPLLSYAIEHFAPPRSLSATLFNIRPRMVNLLIDNGADVNQCFMDRDLSAPTLSIWQVLLLTAVPVAKHMGETPYKRGQYARFMDQFATMRAFVRHGADPSAVVSFRSFPDENVFYKIHVPAGFHTYSALSIAAGLPQHTFREIYDLLREKGAKTSQELALGKMR